MTTTTQLRIILKCLLLCVIFTGLVGLASAQSGESSVNDSSENKVATSSSTASAVDPHSTEKVSVRTPEDQVKQSTTLTDNNVVRPPIPRRTIPQSIVKMVMIGTKYDKYNPRDWEMPFNTAGNTIIGDKFGLRDELARHHMGFQLMYLSMPNFNLYNAPMRGMPADSDGKRYQVYDGQRMSYTGPIAGWLTYTYPRTNTQFVVGANDCWVTWSPGCAGSGMRLNDAYVNQLFFKNRLKVTIGYLYNDSVYNEGYVGGIMGAGTLGENGVLAYEIGQNHGGMATPGANFKYNITKHFIGITGFQRSVNPNGYGEEIKHDSLGFRFNNPGSKLLLIQQYGYRVEAAPGVKKTFVRADGWFNCSHYFDYRSGSLALLNASNVRANRTDNNWMVNLAVDRQLWQPDASLPFCGFYLGGNASYVPPQQNIFTQYYEVRGYFVGLARRRPLDMLELMVTDTEFSKIALRTLSGTKQYGVSIPSQQLGQTTFPDQQSYIGEWAFHLMPGMFLNAGLGYVVHPTFAPRLPNPLLAKASLSLFF